MAARPTRASISRAVLAVVAAAAVGGTGVVVLSSSDSPTAVQAAGPRPAPAPSALAQVDQTKGDTVPWDQPLTVSVAKGRLTSVTVTGPEGAPLVGTLTPQGWTSAATLVPRATYTVHAELVNDDGHEQTYDRAVRAAAAKELKATISPRSGTYGIGQPVIVHFNRPVKSPAARRAVMERLTVTAQPPVAGAWRWYNSYEVHYRGPSYWKPGTAVSVQADLAGLRVPGTKVWGANQVRTGGMTIGRALTAVVDVTAHTMTVKRDGKVVRVMKVSTGRDEYPTKGGVHIVLVREKEHLYNSATIGIPTASPDGYYKKLPWSVRISNGGAFVHANPGTVRYQGRTNVSHGCVNMSVEDAKWFYDNSKLGDIVDVIHAAVGPVRWDAGMADWNYSWATWQKGNLNG